MTSERDEPGTLTRAVIALVAGAGTGLLLAVGLADRLPSAQSGAVAYAAGASVFFFVYGAGDGSPALAYHRTRPLAMRVGDFGVCAVVTVAAALLVATAAGAVAGQLLTEVLIAATAWGTGYVSFARRESGFEDAAGTDPAG